MKGPQFGATDVGKWGSTSENSAGTSPDVATVAGAMRLQAALTKGLLILKKTLQAAHAGGPPGHYEQSGGFRGDAG